MLSNTQVSLLVNINGLYHRAHHLDSKKLRRASSKTPISAHEPSLHFLEGECGHCPLWWQGPAVLSTPRSSTCASLAGFHDCPLQHFHCSIYCFYFTVKVKLHKHRVYRHFTEQKVTQKLAEYPPH